MRRFLSLALILAVASAHAQTPAPDRSGEPRLRELLKKHASLGPVHVNIWQATTRLADDVTTADGQIEFWLRQPNVFRIEQMTMWGTGVSLVSDGKTLRRDTLSQAPVVLFRAPERFPGTDPAVLPGGGAHTLLFLLMEGEAAMGRLVRDNVAIVGGTDGEWETIQFDSIRHGRVTLMFQPRDPNMRVRVIELESGQSADAPPASPPARGRGETGLLTRQEITWQPLGRVSNRMFDASVPPGVEVEDRRTRPPSDG